MGSRSCAVFRVVTGAYFLFKLLQPTPPPKGSWGLGLPGRGGFPAGGGCGQPTHVRLRSMKVNSDFVELVVYVLTLAALWPCLEGSGPHLAPWTLAELAEA